MNNNYYNNHDSNPHSYKSLNQIQEEITMLQEKIEGNTRMLERVSVDQKSVLQSEIIEDQMRIADLEYEINRRNIFYIILIPIILLIILWLLFLLYDS